MGHPTEVADLRRLEPSVGEWRRVAPAGGWADRVRGAARGPAPRAALGGSAPPSARPATALRLADTRTTTTGVVIATYGPAGPAAGTPA